MSDRDKVLGTLPDSTESILPPVFDRARRPSEDLWLEFEERLVALGGKMLPLDALRLLTNRDGSLWVDEDSAELLPSAVRAAPSVWDAEVGICLADFAIAETGSLVVSAKQGNWRMTSLAPTVNVVLVPADAIVATPEDALLRLPKQTTVIITGTSRTADIEGVLVRGVHGPRELYVVRLEPAG